MLPLLWILAKRYLTGVLSSATRYLFTENAAGKVPDAPAELKEWGQQTALGLYFGLLVGGSRQYFRHRATGKWCQAKVL